jgi:hypothetical protein
MPNDPRYPTVTDPENVPEVFCDGQSNVATHGSFAIMTFTQLRPEPGALFKEGAVNLQTIVRARIVITMDNLIALRDLLNRIIQQADVCLSPAGGITRH